MSTLDPTARSTSQSRLRGSRATTHALLRIEGETVSYLDLSQCFRVDEAVIRIAVRRARGLKAGLSWATLHLVMDAEASGSRLPRHRNAMHAFTRLGDDTHDGG